MVNKILNKEEAKKYLLELRKKMEANGSIRELPKEKFEELYGKGDNL